MTRLNAAVIGRDNDVDTTLGRTEVGWNTTVSYREAMDRIGAWIRECYAGKK